MTYVLPLERDPTTSPILCKGTPAYNIYAGNTQSQLICATTHKLYHCTFICIHECLVVNDIYAGGLCNNIGLVVGCLPSVSTYTVHVYMSLHQLAVRTQPSGITILSPVLLVIPIFPLFKFEELYTYLASFFSLGNNIHVILTHFLFPFSTHFSPL